MLEPFGSGVSGLLMKSVWEGAWIFLIRLKQLILL